jgi:phage tail-like protein
MHQHLLPPNSTPLEIALAQTIARISMIPDPVEVVWRPWECPENILPWLAWALSVDVWDNTWTEERKRHVIANAVELHRLKGTAAGLKRHVKLVDSEVKQLVVPPQSAFASRSLTKEEMDAWLRTMPQIRVYLAREVGSGQGLYFANQHFVDNAFACFDAGRALYGRTARLWDRGEEVPLKIVDLTTQREERQALRIERVSIPGNAGKGAFVGRFINHTFVGHVGKAAQIVTYRQNISYEHRLSSLSMRSAHPGLDPVDVRSERVSETGHAGAYAFVRRFVGHVFAGEDRAPWMMYDRIVLHDPARAAIKVPAWSFAGYARLGIRPYTAKTIIDLKDTMHARAAAVGKFIGRCYALPEKTRKRTNARLAVRASKAARDRIFVTHKLTRPRTFADGIPLDGSFTFGARVAFRL